VNRLEYNQKFTPHELAQKTMKDIREKRKHIKEGQKQAFEHCMRNREKIQRRISYGRY
jgi:hypothetical protein